MSESLTFLDALVAALQRAGSYNKNDQTPPAAVLWTDKERQWEPLLSLLRERLPLLTLGPYAPAQRSGPAYWIRCMLARTLPEDRLPENQTPVIYLPGISRQEMRAVEECPKALQPLAELQYRGVLWTHKNGRDWTVAAFLQTGDGGLGVEVAGDSATKEALQRALLKLADEPVAALRSEAPLRAAFFDALLNPDDARRLLLWLNDPSGYRKRCEPAEWAAFGNLCATKYGFHPEKDGELTAARLLGQRQAAWAQVWHRFAEAPSSYPNLPDLLRRARPPQTLPLFDYAECWPQENEAAEHQLRERLAEYGAKHPDEARQGIDALEEEHGPRRAWVWAALGWSPLAAALQHLAALAKHTERSLGGATVAEIAAAYVEWGWQADSAVVEALAAVPVDRPEDVSVVRDQVNAVYRPWLEAAANAFQQAVFADDPERNYQPKQLDAPAPGICLLFSDGLRYDIAQRLAATLARKGLTCDLGWRLAALPGVTSTAKPAMTPVAGELAGGQGLATVVSATGAKESAEVLRKLLRDAGFQTLDADDLGDPTGRAWTELGDVDSYGHHYGWQVAYQIAAELRALAGRVDALLNHGWQRVVVVTDHGWLMLPKGLPKANLPEHLTEVRKGRCARLKESASTDQPWLLWHWDKSVRIALARGICCFEAGKECEHGGLSPQECVVPVLTVARPSGAAGQPIVIQNPVWKGLRCSMTVAGAAPGATVDLRRKPADPGTSLVKPKMPNPDGTVALLVEDDDYLGTAAVIVVLSADGALSAQTPTIVGG